MHLDRDLLQQFYEAEYVFFFDMIKLSDCCRRRLNIGFVYNVF